MRPAKTVFAMTLVITLATLAAQAQPPARPHALTPDQFDSLCRLEAQPRNAAVLDLHASYASERQAHLDKTRKVDDALTTAYLGGVPIALIITLIAAAPL